MLKIWGRRNSLNVQKVMWLVGELNIEHEHIDVGGIRNLTYELKYAFCIT